MGLPGSPGSAVQRCTTVLVRGIQKGVSQRRRQPHHRSAPHCWRLRRNGRHPGPSPALPCTFLPPSCPYCFLPLAYHGPPGPTHARSSLPLTLAVFCPLPILVPRPSPAPLSSRHPPLVFAPYLLWFHPPALPASSHSSSSTLVLIPREPCVHTLCARVRVSASLVLPPPCHSCSTASHVLATRAGSLSCLRSAVPAVFEFFFGL